MFVRQLRPFGARAHRRAFGASKKGYGEKEVTAARSRLTERGRAGFFPVAPSLSRRGQPACAYGAFFRRRKNRLLQRCAYAICPLRRDIRIASGRRASVTRASRGSTSPPAGRNKGLGEEENGFDG